MFKYVIIFAFLAIASCEEPRKRKVSDPFAELEKHMADFDFHYLWPWSQLVRAAAALDNVRRETFEEPLIESNAKKLEFILNVKRFKPDEINIRVKNRYVIVEGLSKEHNNHFVQRFSLPLGAITEDISAVYDENKVLTVTIPKYELPVATDREIPIDVRIPEKIDTTTGKEVSTTVTAPTPIEAELTEATTHVGKIRKKDLKTTAKETKDNEVTKGVEGNGLDYALIETEE